MNRAEPQQPIRRQNGKSCTPNGPEVLEVLLVTWQFRRWLPIFELSTVTDAPGGNRA